MNQTVDTPLARGFFIMVDAKTIKAEITKMDAPQLDALITDMSNIIYDCQEAIRQAKERLEALNAGKVLTPTFNTSVAGKGKN